MNITPLTSLPPNVARHYRGLRRRALSQIYADPPDTNSYQKVFESLVTIEEYIRETARELGRWTHTALRPDEGVEKEFAAAARIPCGRVATIAGLMDLAMYRRERTAEAFWDPLMAAGMKVLSIADGFIPADKPPRQGTRQERGENEVTFGPKTLQLIAVLLEIGIRPEDVIAYRGGVSPCGRRKVPYIIIEIPRLKKQIAVCDQMGQATFICRTIKPLSFWATKGKIALNADSDVSAVRYNSTWQERIRDYLLGKHVVYLDGTLYPKPPVSRRPQLTTATLVRWIKTTWQQENQYPTKTNASLPVWDVDAHGKMFRVEHENWPALDKVIKLGVRGLDEWKGSSLSNFRKSHGIGSELRGGYQNPGSARRKASTSLQYI